MGHGIPNMIGVDVGGLDQKIRRILPGYMSMGQAGMGEMAEMGMPVPRNSTPMAGGRGRFGSITMGGMFTLLRVRDGLAAGDYKDPGPYRIPPGTVANEVNVPQAGEPSRQPGAGKSPGMEMPGMNHGGDQGHQ